MIRLDLTLQAGVLLAIGVAWYIYKQIRQTNFKQTQQPSITNGNANQGEYSESALNQIEPLLDFDLSTTDPIKIRPFKPKYHLTMALENITTSELVAMDKTYSSRIALRRCLISTREKHVLALNPIISPSVLEFYTWMVRTYLPIRFPTLFVLSSPTSSLRNLVTGEDIPLAPESAEHALRILGGNIDDDFLFLLPTAEEGKYRLEGFVTCFPSGFDTAKKLGMSLRDIHGPVPGYAQKLEKSMDRFFASLPVGKIVRRVNWSITTHSDLFCLAGNHTSPEEAQRIEGKREKENVEWRPEDAVLRCERQTLHRLPGTKALIFAFKTYQYKLSDVKAEGSGLELADAIDGLGEGNVPGMRVYKSAVKWGGRVTRYLRGEMEV